MTSSQTSPEKGDKKENKEVTFWVGFLKRILIPVCIKGSVKSTPLSLAEFMVKSAIAKSASYEKEANINADENDEHKKKRNI